MMLLRAGDVVHGAIIILVMYHSVIIYCSEEEITPKRQKIKAPFASDREIL